MKYLALCLFFTLSACGGIRPYAQIATIAGPIIDSAGGAIEEAQKTDVVAERAKNDPATLSERVSELKKRYDPIVAAYDDTSAAFAAFVKALVAAVANDDKTLGEAYLRGILESWLKLEQAAAAKGIVVPKPPQVLIDRVGIQ